jgi:tetratricopeptide (TPR) repeat protein
MRLAASLCIVALACATGCAATPLAPKAIALNDRGARALQSDDLEHAEADIGLALEYNPHFTEAWVNLGLVEMRLGNFIKARAAFHKAIELNPDLPAPFHGRGLLEERMGEIQKAELSYREALKVDPGFGPARVNLGRILFARRDYDGAREQFLRLTEVAPNVVEGWSGLIESLLRLHRDHEADALLDHAREKLGERAPLVILVARRLLREGDAAAAIAALEPITRDDGSPKIQATAYGWIAVARAAQGDIEASQGAAKKALAIDPQNEVALYASRVRTNL